MKGTPPAATIDDYLAAVPDDARSALERLRKLIRSAAPAAVEAISYQIPVFKFHGQLVGFGAFKNHCTFFVMSTRLMGEFAEELAPFDQCKSGIRFPPGKPLPAALIREIVKARIRENQARRAKP